jgi:hypothetical protein
MITAGPNNAGTCVDDATIAGTTWTNASLAQGACNGVNAVGGGRGAVTCALVIGHYLKATNFGFSIPIRAIITSISISITRKAGALSACSGGGGSTGTVQDNSMKIVKAGAISGSEHAAAGNWPTALTAAVYDLSSEIAALGLKPSDINNSGFGVVISQKGTIEELTPMAYVDCFAITIKYRFRKKPIVLGTIFQQRRFGL